MAIIAGIITKGKVIVVIGKEFMVIIITVIIVNWLGIIIKLIINLIIITIIVKSIMIS